METNKTGRNDLCSCGSGLKYKRCCLNKNMNPGWSRLRKIEISIIKDHLTPYAKKKISENIIDAEIAYRDFCQEERPDVISEDPLSKSIFVPWFLFDWIPLDKFGIKDFDPKMTIAQNYVKRYRTRLSDAEERFIEVANTSYFSFYSVLEVEFEKTILIKDIILETTHTVIETVGTHCLKAGDIFFSRVITLDEQSILFGIACLKIPASHSTSLINFRNWLIAENGNEKLNPTLLRSKFALELRDYYFRFVRADSDVPPAKLVDTKTKLVWVSESPFDSTVADTCIGMPYSTSLPRKKIY